MIDIVLANSDKFNEKELFSRILGILQSQKDKTNSNTKAEKNKAVLKILDSIKHEKDKTVLVALEVIKSEFNLNSEDLISLLTIDKGIFPIEIFAERKLSLLQASVKYLKENLGYTNKKISDVIGRDPRSIWAAYEKAKTRKKEDFIIVESEIKIPFSVFKDKLTLLEPLVLYLKSLDWSNRKIARVLNRGETTISTIYRRSLVRNG